MGLKDLVCSYQADKSDAVKKPNKIIIGIIIFAIAILLFTSVFPDNDDDKISEAEPKINIEKYIENEEKRLSGVLKKINGAGNVSVFISIDDGGEKLLARNNKSKTSDEKSESGETKKDEESESQIVMSGKSSDGNPFVVEEKNPEVIGVLVVADGASSERVRNEIYEAVRSIYGVSPHRIKVTY